MRKSCTKIGGAKLRKGLWLPEEDEKLINYMLTHDGTAECSWGDVARNAGLQRCGRSCRLRWINYLRPDLKRGAFSPHEEGLIFHLHSLHGNRWSQIAAHLPGRTDNEIKNFWYSRVKKRLKNSTSASSPNGSNSSMSMQEEGIMAMCINDPSSSSLSSSSSSKRSMAPLSHIIDPFMHDGDGYDDHGMLEHSHDNINGSLQGEFSVPSLKSVVIKANDPIIDKDNQFDNSQSCNNTDIINTNKVKIEPNDRSNWLEGDQECRLREQNLEDLTKDISSFSFYGHIPKNMLYFLYVLSQLDKSLEFPE